MTAPRDRSTRAIRATRALALALPALLALVVTTGAARAEPRPAATGPVWLAPKALGAATDVGDLATASNAAGTTALLHTRPGPASTSSTSELVVRVRKPGGAFGAPFVLATTTLPAHDLQVGVTADGRVLAAWVELDGAQERVGWRVRPVTGAWSGVSHLHSAPRISGLRMEVAPGGRTGLVWSEHPTGDDPADEGTLYWSFGSASSGVEPAAPIGGDLGQSSPDLALAPNGDALIAWTQSGETGFDIQTCARPATATGCDIDVIDTSPLANRNQGAPQALSPSVAVDQSGDGIVVFNADSSADAPDAIVRTGYARRVISDGYTFADARWTRGRLASLPGEDTDEDHQVVLRDDGSAVLAYVGPDDAVRVAVRPDGTGGFRGHDTLDYQQDSLLDLQRGAKGDVVLATVGATRGYYGRALSVAVLRRNQDEFDPARVLQRDGGVDDPRVAVDDQGNAVAAFNDGQDGTAAVWTTFLDVAAPTLDVDGPTSLSKGAKGTWSAQVSDRVGPVKVTWRLGTHTGTGTSFKHVFVNKGSFVLITTATDAAGHATTRRTRITVS